MMSPHALLHETVGTPAFWWGLVIFLALVALAAGYLVVRVAARLFGRGRR